MSVTSQRRSDGAGARSAARGRRRSRLRPRALAARSATSAGREAPGGLESSSATSLARWAEIARAAAEAPVIVVMQGRPWRTAALRIS